MATKAKAANYDAKIVAEMTSAYVAGREAGDSNADIVATIAEDIGKTPASVRAKLAAEGVYQKEEAAKTAGSRMKKADIVAAIVGKGVPLNDAEAEGLEKATASALQKVLARLTN